MNVCPVGFACDAVLGEAAEGVIAGESNAEGCLEGIIHI